MLKGAKFLRGGNIDESNKEEKNRILEAIERSPLDMDQILRKIIGEVKGIR